MIVGAEGKEVSA